ncbi:histone-lysine N-methyltransferase, H3 lysine-9 specific SUVH5-like [Nicotiana tabacum]|uniref:Histone-lysine N-methyltransferase, H3 lysine-9 specific SUVH5-like n=2 Tax=Nicotiana tabacum TaxID=4097 RepID=A0AC58UP58_TOBAC
MSVLAETSPSKMFGEGLHQSVGNEYPRSPSTFKRLKVDTTRKFPENCGLFVGQTKGSRIQCYTDAEIYPEFPSTSKSVKVEDTWNYTEISGMRIPQTNGHGTQCPADAEIKSSSGVAMNVIESAKPLRVFVPNTLNDKPANEVRESLNVIESAKPLRVFVPNILNGKPANEVREALKLFDDLYSKLLREDKAEKREGQPKRNIIIEAAVSLKKQNKWVNCEWTFGHVPGVEIGDQFRFRAELVVIGLHRHYIKGIDYVNINGKDVATAVVDSGRYDNEAISSQTFIYVGQGGNPKVSASKVEDQKLEGGNLALKNSMDLGYPVRVIGSRQRVKDQKSDIRYIYEGLYTVTKCSQERGPTGKFIFKFELKRNSAQSKLTCELVSQPANLGKVNHLRQNVNKATKSVMQFVQREIVVDYDISQGKEKIPIPAVNAIDDERPPPFTYITKMQYPDWYYISMPQGCSCTSGCSDSEQCSCASRNGGEIQFNTRGSIIRAKHLVYECGPSCKCPPSCKNRVSQHGPRYHLEVFKTESRGWGLRSRDYVSSGSFICEYVGELLDEKEAEKRIDHDEYLFDVGNYDEETPKRNKKFEVESNSFQRKDEDGFTLDAARYGNVGRFINHSCSPNLYAQNVMYDHGDRRVPHIMFFASKSIAPIEELTYDYNYQIDQVYDANGNLKKKNCKCGSRKCSGRMY